MVWGLEKGAYLYYNPWVFWEGDRCYDNSGV